MASLRPGAFSGRDEVGCSGVDAGPKRYSVQRKMAVVANSEAIRPGIPI